MSEFSPPSETAPAAPSFRHSFEGLAHQWWWFLLLGIGLVVLGFFALGSAFFASVMTVVVFGVILLAAGIGQLVSAFWSGRSHGFLLHILIGILYIVNGLLIVDAPVRSTLALTLLVAGMFFVLGIFRICASLAVQFSGWGWTLLNGIISVLLGVMIYRQWPASGEFVIGLFVGIDLLFAGMAWIMLAFGLRNAKA